MYMKKVIIDNISKDDMNKTIDKVNDIIDKYHYCYDKTRTVIFDKIWYFFKPVTKAVMTLYSLNDYSYNSAYDEYICIYPTSFSSFVILVKKDNKINTIFKIYNVIDDQNCKIKKYVIKDNSVFEFPAIVVARRYFFSNCLYDDLLLRTEFDEVKVADEISDMTGYDFRYPVDKLKSNWTLYLSYAHDSSTEDRNRIDTYKNLIERSDAYTFSKFKNSFYIIIVDKKTKDITRMTHIERVFDCNDEYWSDYYFKYIQYKRYTIKMTDYYINSYDRTYVDNHKSSCSDSSDLNNFFIEALNNSIMNTKRNHKLEQDTFDLISFINSRTKGPESIAFNSPLRRKDFILFLFLICVIILIIRYF